MNVSPRKLNTFLIFKLPAAFFCGVRTKVLDDAKCVVSVKHRWINQNPFNSMFWAVQGMAAELTTGALVMSKELDFGLDVFVNFINIPILPRYGIGCSNNRSRNISGIWF